MIIDPGETRTMEESNEEPDVDPGTTRAEIRVDKDIVSYGRGRANLAFPFSELYFLIAKFLCGGPLKETAKVNSIEKIV